MSYTYDYEMPAVTVDALIIRQKSDDAGEWRTEVLLIKRKNEPFKGAWAFPGGFVDKFEEPIAACVREVKEETGIDLSEPIRLFCAAGGKDRDPRGWVIALTYHTHVSWDTEARPNDDAIEVAWFDIMDPPPMAFDHAMALVTFKYGRR